MGALARWWSRRSFLFRFGAAGAAMMAAFYLFVYYPHAPGSWPGRLLTGYVVLHAQACGFLLHLFDPSVATAGVLISGRFPLLIVLDCVAPDSMALYAAATLAFPAPLMRKAIGLTVGLGAIAAMNMGRIVALYLVGVHAPQQFGVMHEEVLQMALVAAVAFCFAGYVNWIRLPRLAATLPVQLT